MRYHFAGHGPCSSHESEGDRVLVGLSALAIAVIRWFRSTTGGMTLPSADPGPPARPHDARTGYPDRRPRPEPRAEARQAAKAARADRLFRQNGCWNGEAPAGVVPTHALVTLPGQQPALVAADVGFGNLDGRRCRPAARLLSLIPIYAGLRCARLLPPTSSARLRAALEAADFTVDAVRALLGEVADAALLRNETTPGAAAYRHRRTGRSRR